MKKIALAFDHEKEATLYFDKIVPVSLKSFVDSERPPKDNIFKQLCSLLPEELKVITDTPRTASDILGLDKNYYSFITLQSNITLHALTSKDGGISEKDIIQYERDYLNGLKKMLSYDYAIVGSTMSDENEQKNETCIQLTNLNLIDTTKASWEQIIDIKKDEKLMKQLRAFRLLFEENYIGKDPEYIKDSILKKIDDYEIAAKKAGFDLKKSIWNVLISKETFLLSLLPIIFKRDHLSFDLTNCLMPGILFLGNLGIEIKNYLYSKEELRSNNPITYVMDVAKKLQN